MTNGYNGADLEAIVKDAIENCFIDGKEQLTTEDLKTAQKNIKSISSTLEKRIKEIKEAVKDMDLKPASNPENKIAAKPTPKKTVETEDNVVKTAESISSLSGVLGSLWWKG